MSTVGGLLLTMGIGFIMLALMARFITERPPPPPQSATQERIAEARRSTREIREIVAPWMLRIGGAAAITGLVLVLIAYAL